MLIIIATGLATLALLKFSTRKVLFIVGFSNTKFTAISLQDLKWKVLEFRVLWLFKKALSSREEPDSSLPIVNGKHTLTRFLFTRYARIISTGSTVECSIHIAMIWRCDLLDWIHHKLDLIHCRCRQLSGSAESSHGTRLSMLQAIDHGRN